MSADFARHCDEIVIQTRLLTGHMRGADLTVPVPTCPGWNVSQLLRHVDGGQRWARDIVATRASQPPSDVALRDLSGAADEDPDSSVGVADRGLPSNWQPPSKRPDRMRRCGARSTAAAQRSTPAGSPSRPRSTAPTPHWRWVCRSILSPDVAADALDEWMQLGCLPFHFEVHSWMRELLAPGSDHRTARH